MVIKISALSKYSKYYTSLLLIKFYSSKKLTRSNLFPVYFIEKDNMGDVNRTRFESK